MKPNHTRPHTEPTSNLAAAVQRGESPASARAHRRLAPSLMVGLLTVAGLLAGCDKQSDTQAAASAASAASAAPVSAPVSAPAYTPPTADQLYQMVAPIALFPDKLVALVLAGSTYPDQVTAANQWLQQNPNLKGDALAQAANQQPWDPSIKSLTAFPAVLDQMARNIQWTTALGQAYANDPSDVMNAIQVMRQRAQASGNLKTSSRLNVVSVAQSAPPPDYGTVQIAPPAQIIEIAPVQPDVVYVPTYDPGVVYGQPVHVYPGYDYRPPREYSGGEVAAIGALSFGAGIAIGAAVAHHYDWGWHSWGVNWGGPARGAAPAQYGHGGDENRGNAWHRPAVVYNNTTYVTKSTTVVNHINNVSNVNNVNNTRIDNTHVQNNQVTNNTAVSNHAVNNDHRGQPENRPGAVPGPNGVHPGAQPNGAQGMTVPHFNAQDTHQGARPNPAEQARAAERAPGAMQPAAQVAHGAAAQEHQAAQPHAGPMAGGAPHQAGRPEQAMQPHAQPQQQPMQPHEQAHEQARPVQPREQHQEQRPQPQVQHVQPQPQPHAQPQQHEQPHPQQHEQQHEQPHPQQHEQQHREPEHHG